MISEGKYKKRSSLFLVPKVMERFLVELVNATTLYTRDDLVQNAKAMDGIRRLVEGYPQLLPMTELDRDNTDAQHLLVADTQRLLRKAWDAKDLREREWYTFLARKHHYEFTVIWPKREARMMFRKDGDLYVHPDPEMWTPEERAMLDTPPPLTPFEQVLFHFHRIAERARHCGNPECPAPYFLAKRNSQRYCSPECAGPMAKDQKRRWWRDNRGGSK